MKKDKKARLERAGWKVGTVRELLGLSKAEEALVELKLILSRGLRERRARRRLTQAQLARLLNSSQSRVAKMEAGDPSVSIDLLIRSLFAMGTTQRELAQAIGHKTKEFRPTLRLSCDARTRTASHPAPPARRRACVGC